jgi:hypothetical protein
MRDSKYIQAGVAAFILLAGSCSERAIAQSAPETTGPYKVVMEMDASLPEHTVYRPEQVSRVKGKLPVVAYGNGACANAGNAFENYLAEVASYGLLVVANGPIDSKAPGRPPKPGQPFPPLPPPPQGDPSPANRGGRVPFQQSKTSALYETMDWANVQNGKDGSPYKGKLDITSMAVMGQSCGGLQALEAAGDPRVKTAVILNSGIIRNTVPLSEGEGQNKGAPMRVPIAGLVLPGNPETLKKLHTPIIYVIGGESDIAFKNAEQDFSEIEAVPVFKANMDTGHNGTYWQPHGGKFAEVATEWLLWQLKGDKKSGAMFTGKQCGLCKAPEWQVARKNWK